MGLGQCGAWILTVSQTLLYLWHPLTLWLVWFVCTSGLSLLYHILVPDTAWSAHPTCARLFSLLRVAMAETPGTRGATRCCRCGRRAAGSSRPMTEGSSCGSIGTCWVQSHGMIGVAEVRVGALLQLYPYWEPGSYKISKHGWSGVWMAAGTIFNGWDETWVSTKSDAPSIL